MGIIIAEQMAAAPTTIMNFVPGPALDYSFMELETVAELLDEEPRAGVLSTKSRLRQVDEKKEVVQVAGSKKVGITVAMLHNLLTAWLPQKQKPKVKSQYEVTPITTCIRVCNNK